MGLDIQELFEAVEEHFVFDQRTYPNFPEDPLQQQLFAIRHVQDHISKSHAVVAKVMEQTDHSGEPLQEVKENEEDLQFAAMKQLVNATKLAQLVGVTAESFERYMDWKYPA